MDKLANAITSYYVAKNVITKDKQEIYSYGFKLIIADVINYIIIITLGIILNRLPESILYLVSLCGLRRFTGGFHAKTFWLCRLSMVITYMCVMLLSDAAANMEYKMAVVLSINIISIIFIAVFAPIEHPNKPLSDEQKHNNKIKSVITSAFMSAAACILIAAGVNFGVTISITLLAVVILMIIGSVTTKGGKDNV